MARADNTSTIPLPATQGVRAALEEKGVDVANMAAARRAPGVARHAAVEALEGMDSGDLRAVARLVEGEEGQRGLLGKDHPLAVLNTTSQVFLLERDLARAPIRAGDAEAR